ncbi:MAG: hypothetical protein FWG44_03945 [Oscillospiraceae bacterium]|nr:hypothetical protein [Oscillospiraceae bacterium]
MFRNGTDKCSCPHIECKRNGKCDECFAYHKGQTYCKKNPISILKQKENEIENN